MLKHLPPVYSPLTIKAILNGVYALLCRNDNYKNRVTQLIQDKYNSLQIIFTNSGTSALRLSLEILANQYPNQPVALPAYCCYDIATASIGAKIKVLLYDIDPVTLSPAIDSLKSVLVHNPIALIIAHLYGIPVDIKKIKDLIDPINTILIEDAAQGSGASIDGEPLGTFGSLGILSFGRGKGLTGGQGGALLVNDDFKKLINFSNLKLRENNNDILNIFKISVQWLFSRPSLYSIPANIPWLKLGETIYRPPIDITTPTDSIYPILSETFNLEQDEIITRQKNAKFLMEHLAFNSLLRPVFFPSNTIAGYLRLPVITSDKIISSLKSNHAKKLGIISGYPYSLNRLSQLQEYLLNPKDNFHGSKLLANYLVTLPTHSYLKTNDLDNIVNYINELIHTHLI